MPLCTWTPIHPSGTSNRLSPWSHGPRQGPGQLRTAVAVEKSSQPGSGGDSGSVSRRDPHEAGAWRSSAMSGQKRLGLQTEQCFFPRKRRQNLSAFTLMGLRVHASQFPLELGRGVQTDDLLQEVLVNSLLPRPGLRSHQPPADGSF